MPLALVFGDPGGGRGAGDVGGSRWLVLGPWWAAGQDVGPPSAEQDGPEGPDAGESPRLRLEAWVRGQGCDQFQTPRHGCWAAVQDRSRDGQAGRQSAEWRFNGTIAVTPSGGPPGAPRASRSRLGLESAPVPPAFLRVIAALAPGPHFMANRWGNSGHSD